MLWIINQNLFRELFHEDHKQISRLTTEKNYTDFKFDEDKYSRYDGYKVTTDKQEILVLIYTR